MRIGTSYKQHGIQGNFDVIVIGSGIGGLATAALLTKHGGKRVLVLERHYTAGGFTHTFHRRGYEWDVGVHYIGQTQPGTLLRRAFDEISNDALEWADMGEVYDTIVFPDARYEFRAGWRNFRESMINYFPDQEEAILSYLSLVHDCVKASRGYFAEKVLPRHLASVVGPLMRRKATKLASQTTLGVLRELTNDRRLIAVLTGQFGDYGLPPAQSSFFMHSLVVNHYFGGAAYPVGGSGRIAETIIPVIEDGGGSVITSAEVDTILVENNRAVGVRLADGSEHRAEAVISNAGVVGTYAKLLPPATRAKHGLEEKLGAVRPSVAHASLYLGFKKTAAELGLSKGNLWVYPTDDHDANVARFVSDPDAPLPVAYISFPSAKDPDFERRYPGRATVEVVTLAPFERFAAWKDRKWGRRGDQYNREKETLTQKLLAALFEQCPQLENEVDHCELSTPLSTRHFANFGSGEIYGLDHDPQRFAQRWLVPKTPIRGLYLTGSDICSAGVGGALMGGVLSGSAVLGKNLLKPILAR